MDTLNWLFYSVAWFALGASLIGIALAIDILVDTWPKGKK